MKTVLIIPFVLSIIFLSCDNSYKLNRSKKCLWCNTYLGKSGENTYAVFYQKEGTNEISNIIDSVEKLNFQSCFFFIEKHNAYFIAEFGNKDLNILGYASYDKMNEYCKLNNLITDFDMPSAEDFYNILPPRATCK